MNLLEKQLSTVYFKDVRFLWVTLYNNKTVFYHFKAVIYYKLRGINIIFPPNIRLYPHTAFFRLYLMTALLSLYKLRFVSSMKLRPKLEQHSSNKIHVVTVRMFCWGNYVKESVGCSQIDHITPIAQFCTYDAESWHFSDRASWINYILITNLMY